ncbi:MAG: biopolymer transporter ExbD [Tidjanibacter sp.]|nr:biopolymer transporter ExbD [Tidjanibacter sp.]
MARKTPEINASSMADVAFLLLIFFLVATTMDIDSGLNRVLPPWSEQQTDAPDIRERNLMLVHVNKYDQIAVQGELVQVSQLKDRAKEWVLNTSNDSNLPEKKNETIDFIGEYPVSQGVISLQNDRGTSYEMYIKVQNELTRAFNEIRDELSKAHFGRPYAELDKEQQDAIADAVPMKISEAEPQNIK